MSQDPPRNEPFEPYRPLEPKSDEIPLIRAAQIDLIDERPEYVVARGPRRRPRFALILLLLTIASTFYAGGHEFGIVKENDPLTGRVIARHTIGKFILAGLTYSVAVLAILGAHEMGHYLQARRYGVPASLPYFIPMPFTPIGTMGAVIVQGAGAADRKAMFDIAISGPLAGLVLALPLTYYGLSQSQLVHFSQIPESDTFLGLPLLVKWMLDWVFPNVPRGYVVDVSPMYFAGWVGIFITGLNLIPIGQLDGGHILYTLLRGKAHYVARALFFFALFMVLFGGMVSDIGYGFWAPMLFLLWLMGIYHPPTADDRVPLGLSRIVLGWLTLAFVVVGFVPTPMYELRIERKLVPKPSPDDIVVDTTPRHSLVASSR